ncbi:hypothetical protein [Phaffia rhodozyma]|uniref:Uncharacterized protein n=1 Tax=Phaffia rhodozyma TaxID=264483 RepID=A0A0F7SJR6_PHARH|nr:hypothetical protein [Phaffia rhodozyma]
MWVRASGQSVRFVPLREQSPLASREVYGCQSRTDLAKSLPLSLVKYGMKYVILMWSSETREFTTDFPINEKIQMTTPMCARAMTASYAVSFEQFGGQSSSERLMIHLSVS